MTDLVYYTHSKLKADPYSGHQQTGALNLQEEASKFSGCQIAA